MSQPTWSPATWGGHPVSATLGQPWCCPLQGTSFRLREKGSGEKPLISDLSFNLLIKQQAHLCLLPQSSKISTMIMNLKVAPNSSPGMADNREG